MTNIKKQINKIRDKPEIEIRFSLRDTSNAMLVDMLIEALKLIQLYQIKDEK